MPVKCAVVMEKKERKTPGNQHAPPSRLQLMKRRSVRQRRDASPEQTDAFDPTSSC